MLTAFHFQIKWSNGTNEPKAGTIFSIFCKKKLNINGSNYCRQHKWQLINYITKIKQFPNVTLYGTTLKTIEIGPKSTKQY